MGLSRFSHRPYLDGLRGLAVLCVVLSHFHAPFLPGGFLGVDLFFVLSGYLITARLLLERDEGPIDLRDFWLRRIRRLMPPLVAALLCTVLLIRFEGRWPLWREWRHELYAAAAYLLNWKFIAEHRDYFSPDAPSPFGHLWSLAIEEQFYLVWPLLLAALTRRPRGAPDAPDAPRVRRRLVASMGGLALLSIAAMARLGSASPMRAYYGTDTRLHALVLGGLAAALLHRGPAAREGARAPSLGTIALLAVLGGFVRFTAEAAPLYFRGGSAAFAASAAGLIALLELRPNPASRALLEGAPLRWCGKVSYAAYLWHWPVAIYLGPWLPAGIAGTLCGTAATFALAALSWSLIERPFARATGALAGRGALRLLAGAGAGWAAVLALAAVSLATSADDELRATFGNFDCPGRARVCEVEPGPANAPRPPMVIATLGDSIPLTLTAGFAALARERGLRFVQGATAACRLTPLRVVRDVSRQGDRLVVTPPLPEEADCVANVARDQEELISRFHPSLIVLSSMHEGRTIEASPGRYVEAGSPEHRALEEASLEETYRRLTREGARLLVLLPPRKAAPMDCGPSRRGRCATPEVETGIVYSRQLLTGLAARHPEQIGLVDISDQICGAKTGCPRNDLRIDGSHFTRITAIPVVQLLWSEAHGDELLRALAARAAPKE